MEMDFIKEVMSGRPIYLNAEIPLEEIKRIEVKRIPNKIGGAWRGLAVLINSKGGYIGDVNDWGFITTDKGDWAGAFTSKPLEIIYEVYNESGWTSISEDVYKRLKTEYPMVSIREFPSRGPFGVSKCREVTDLIHIV